MVREAGPLIFIHCHALIFPSGSLDLLPSSITLSIGKVIVKSGPAKAIGGWLWSIQLSQDNSFWHEGKRKVTKNKKASPYNSFHCMIIDLKAGILFTKRA